MPARFHRAEPRTPPCIPLSSPAPPRVEFTPAGTLFLHPSRDNWRRRAEVEVESCTLREEPLDALVAEARADIRQVPIEDRRLEPIRALARAQCVCGAEESQRILAVPARRRDAAEHHEALRLAASVLEFRVHGQAASNALFCAL